MVMVSIWMIMMFYKVTSNKLEIGASVCKIDIGMAMMRLRLLWQRRLRLQLFQIRIGEFSMMSIGMKPELIGQIHGYGAAAIDNGT